MSKGIYYQPTGANWEKDAAVCQRLLAIEVRADSKLVELLTGFVDKK